jgi:hypothetical protein
MLRRAGQLLLSNITWSVKPTEGRLSIRESLATFGRISKYLADRPKEISLFERMMDRFRSVSKLRMSARPMGCGHTNQSFASLFFSQEQQRHLSRHTDGTSLSQIVGNFNIVAYGVRKRWQWPASAERAVQSFMNSRATGSVTGLSNTLLEQDSPEVLPRVVFINMAWVLHQQGRQHQHQQHQQHQQHHQQHQQHQQQQEQKEQEQEEQEQDAKCVKDHQFAIIKHGNNNFQVVQGYIGSLTKNCNSLCESVAAAAAAAATTVAVVDDQQTEGGGGGGVGKHTDLRRREKTIYGGNGSVERSGGYCLSSWQNQPAGALGATRYNGGRYASRHGFSLNEMAAFVVGLERFAAEQTFSAANYKALFGVYHPESDGLNAWPSLTWRELDDAHIKGSGVRYTADQFEAFSNSDSGSGSGSDRRVNC